MSKSASTLSPSEGVSVAVGIVGTIYLTPPVWNLLSDDALRFLHAQYDPSHAQIIHTFFGWFAYLGTFYLIRVSMRAVSVLLALAAVRFF